MDSIHLFYFVPIDNYQSILIQTHAVISSDADCLSFMILRPIKLLNRLNCTLS